MSWTLALYIYAGALAKGDSVTITTIPGFQTKAHCEAAGAASQPLVAGSTKNLRHVCIQTGAA